MSRYIDAVTLKAEFTGNFTDEYPSAFVKTIIDLAPTANVVEVRNGKWINLTPPEYLKETIEMRNNVIWMCSECKNASRFLLQESQYEYCPWCGARMVLDDK